MADLQHDVEAALAPWRKPFEGTQTDGSDDPDIAFRSVAFFMIDVKKAYPSLSMEALAEAVRHGRA